MRQLTAIALSIVVLPACVGCAKKAVESPKKVVKSAEEKPVPVVEAKKMIKTASGLEYSDVKVGEGPEAKASSSVTVHYKGWLDDGTVFDTSRKPGWEPLTFTLGGGEVIKGWDEGVQGMRVGGVRELVVPPSLGYGDQDMGQIPPNSTLHFEVELLKIGS